MRDSRKGWLLLAATQPGREASSARVRLWRALKDMGAINLRDGVTLVPASAVARERFRSIADEIEADGGAAWVLELPAQAPSIEKRFKDLFDRTDSYRALGSALTALRKDIASVNEATARRRLRQAEHAFDAITALDFFPCDTQRRTRETLENIRTRIDRRFSPAEPSPSTGTIPKRDVRDFQGATWATRKRLWVDRAASAWLIRRFIDRRATFKWLDKPSDCPKSAYGFDFDGAAFTHVENLVTFEVLLAAFDLAGDAGLVRLGGLVHYLDVGGDPVPEAAGFEAVLTGLRDGSKDDDALLQGVTPVLDALHQHFMREQS